MATLLASIFNDVIGPIMRGPSSSHSAASVRIGLLIHDLLGGVPDRLEIDYDSSGSLATTHESQGTDMGLYGGLLGYEPDDPRLPNSPDVLPSTGCTIEVRKPELGDPHPNTYRILGARGSREHRLVALSTGGGMIEVVELDGVPVSLFGDYAVTLFDFGTWRQDPSVVLRTNSTDLAAQASAFAGELLSTHGEIIDTVEVIPGELEHGGALVVVSSGKPLTDEIDCAPDNRRDLRAVLPVLSRRDMVVPFSHASELSPAADLAVRPLSDWALEYEMSRGDIAAPEVHAQARRMLDIMAKGVETGLAGTDYEDRILGWQSGRFVDLQRQGSLLDGGLLNDMIAYVTALMEAKSAMEVIIAAPTAGACATFPGALLAAIDAVEATDEAAERALLTGGLIGVFVTNRSSFAAEVGGCQAETGAGAAMAAAALVELAGGSAALSLSAASQALQNVLGLICDPVGNRVEAPCLGRNVAGAANALSCANMALAGYDHVVPFDEVLDAHRNVSELMARELRCTGLSGLAITPTAQRIELDLSRHRR